MQKIKAKKIAMTQIFSPSSGEVFPVSLLEVKDMDSLEEGKVVNVQGISRGKGFQGVVKRWGFKGGPASHGHKHARRAPGSIGGGGIQRVLLGKKMAGRTGGRKVTVKNLQVVKVDADKKLVAIKGAVPGTRGTELNIIIK